MIIRRIQRKLYKMTHPAVAEVWMLHRVVDTRSRHPEERKLEVTAAFLEHLIESRLAAGCRFVSLDDVMQNLDTAAPRHRRTAWIAVTIDEGCRETLGHVVPLFQRHRIPFTLFVTTGFVEGAAPISWYRQQPVMMSWAELEALAMEPLCTLGGHTASHPHLCHMETDRARVEIAGCRQILEEYVQTPIRYFSYPYGERNDSVKMLAKEAGYSAAFEAWGGQVRIGADRYDLPRIPVIQPN
ncbi:MAG: Bll protein [bacterium P3]|nr:MAG: Bll protein [bacterium P201]KWW30483.1 MAG: Bll protein [bacterium P3]KWW41370.1 MAG: Bll protein [bacterium F083]